METVLIGSASYILRISTYEFAVLVDVITLDFSLV